MRETMNVDEALIRALENLVIITEEQYANRRMIDGDEVIVINSANCVKRFRLLNVSVESLVTFAPTMFR